MSIEILVNTLHKLNEVTGNAQEALLDGKWQVGHYHLVWMPYRGVRLMQISDADGSETYPMGEDFRSNEDMAEALVNYTRKFEAS